MNGCSGFGFVTARMNIFPPSHFVSSSSAFGGLAHFLLYSAAAAARRMELRRAA